MLLHACSRPIVEIFINNGRASHVAVNPFDPSLAEIAIVNKAGTAAVQVFNVTAFGMGCGWTSSKPIPSYSRI